MIIHCFLVHWPGEVYHQFHDDMKENYPKKYNDLKDRFYKSGKLGTTGCPENVQSGAIFAI